MQKLRPLPFSHLSKNQFFSNQFFLIKNFRSFSTTTILSSVNEQQQQSNNSTENMMKRLNPNRQFKQFWNSSWCGKYDAITSAAFDSLKLFGNNPKELTLDNQLEMKYLPIIIHRKCDGKIIRQPGLYKTLFSIYPSYDCFGYGIHSELSKKLYCSNVKTLNEFNNRRLEYSKAIEYMEKAKEDFSNILLPMKMIPISEMDVWQWFKGHSTQEHDVLIIKYMDTESLIEIFVQLANYCNESSILFEVPFQRFPIQISFANEFQKSVIQSAIEQALQRTEDEKFSKQDVDLMKQFLNKPDILASEKMGNIYFPKMRNNLLSLSEFFLLFIL
ncbi:predicted protein [Naegleria gruberi]|uniref:Predicted protein n=1 Tax=Naegleria gruberi TaxID=5762 RepID=D2V8H1_NAEGR|nr:uncharacterized protein NAEGRDRAFT_65153 [Naegleria gruberi]EFC46808.1 predicted protein [Naegleria gruberi]|eukprot:XP_002679552.1 predicted protein [Naegleria gruberi strain NEG-M]